ncbi:VOC family protein [Thermomicrobium sp. 4228-Ro]|uniref:VOC family protein n=1 Tax=Thermomicrobium sp. 4228-Ro TaxID=2993937 RepID=UPI0022494F1B|nr:VOC family protein [Thermomicrobium sp. 4228-Ro]MCX2727273.1 VOC family protein [Thermomicrobium sp. 4228-Ro]
MVPVPVVGIHHIGIVVENLDEAIEAYQKLGLTFDGVKDFPHTRVALFHGGEGHVELFEPKDPESDLGRYLRERGGIHHVAYAVRDIRTALAQLEQEGFELIHREPVIGLHGFPVAFIHPRSCHRVLTELVEVPEGEGH